MPLEKADLIIHPARLQIVQLIAGGALSTTELAERLPALPKSSIYRHLRLLLEGGLVEVAATRLVKGTLEKFYRLAQAPHLSQEKMGKYGREDQMRLFATFLAAQLQEFSDYMEENPGYNFQRDHSGFSTLTFYASSAELDHLLTELRSLLMRNAVFPPEEGRKRHKIAIITHPFHSGETKS
jgi:DNA-binding transcriptional ArsR family regulator